MDRFPDKIDSKFRFVLVASSRAEQLMRGAPAKVDPRGRKATMVALEELSNDLVSWDMGEPPAPEPLAEEEVAVEEEATEELSEPN